MEWPCIRLHLMIAITVGVATSSSIAQNANRPFVEWLAHNQGNLQIEVDNCGNLGAEGLHMQLNDPLTGEPLRRGMIYPKRSDIWSGGPISIRVGAIVGNDTLVSTSSPWQGEPHLGGEFWPDLYPFGAFKYESNNFGGANYSPSARSELDLVCAYADTLTNRLIVGRNEPRDHIPLGIKVTQRSMAWGAANIDDFILVDYTIENIGHKILKDVYVGVIALAHFGYYTDWNPAATDNLVGFLKTWPAPEGCGFDDTINIAYGMDNDGDPSGDQWDYRSPLAASGVCLLKLPIEPIKYNYNWWSSYIDWQTYQQGEWEPRPRGTEDDPFLGDGSGDRDFGPDANRYYVMRHHEFDYDQMYSAVDMSEAGWKRPDQNALVIASGGWTEYMLSFGGFTLGPGAKAGFTIAIVAGDNIHVNPTDFATYWNPYNPAAYYETLDFTELATNARWAKWVYDNPGVDTDGDGYFGKFRVCDADTQWYEGDGVPDFRADIPPPSPKLKVIPSLGKLVIRWNGYYSENTIDPFTRQKDFEGYRVYVGLDDRESSMSTMISWDYQDYNRYYLKKKPNNTFAWVTGDLPFTLDSLRTLYGSTFNPLLYTKENPLHILDTLYMFTPVDYNMSSLIAPGVHKVYPEARYLGTDTSQWTEDDLTTEHGGRLPKYYEYEYEIDNLLPTIAQYVSVTAFDFGFSKGNIPAKESSKRQNMTVAYAQTSSDSAVDKGLNVYVYPNPYRLYVNYAAQGYENHDNRQIPSRSHRVNFGNLPPKCKISIFSLDGDLIRSWDHDYSPTDPQAMHDAWDLITRNTMLVVSGLYYWVVESEGRTQIGKFVVIE
jgi:hypothetical protein